MRHSASLALHSCDLVHGVGVQARIDPTISNVWSCQGAYAPPWLFLAALAVGSCHPASAAWPRWSASLHRWYRLRSSVSHSLCPACVHSLLSFSPTATLYPDASALIDALLTGFDPGINTNLKHTFRANDPSPRWSDAIAAAKLQKDIDRGFLRIMPSRPLCRSCCRRPSTRIPLLLVDKDSRAAAFDPTLASYNRLAWNFSAPSPVAVNEWIPVHTIPDFVVYGSSPRAERMILAVLDSTPTLCFVFVCFYVLVPSMY